MTEAMYVAALEEIFKLTLRSEGKRERKTRAICVQLLGERRCNFLSASDEIARAKKLLQQPHCAASRKNAESAKATDATLLQEGKR